MTPHALLLLILTFALCSACSQPPAQPKEAKAAKVEAKFIPENPNFPEAGTANETAEEIAIRTWWNDLEGGDPQPIAASGAAQTALLDLPFGSGQPAIEALLPSGWKQVTEEAPPIYDPSLIGFSVVRYTLSNVPVGSDAAAVAPHADATLGFHEGQFGDQRLVFHELPGGGNALAELLITKFGQTAIERSQESDPAAKVHRKMITLTWRIVEEGKRSGFISYQATFAGPTAGSAEALLQPGDKFVHASFTTMSPDMMTALRAANPVGSGTTP